MTTTALFKSLSYRPFAMLWLGQTVSRLGDSLYAVAMAWWVLQQTGSAAAMGAVLTFAFAPMLLFTLLGGVLADRLPRIRVMVVSDLLSGAVVTAIALLAFAGNLELWHVYLASAVFGFVSAFFEPAYQAVIPDVAPREALSSANSLTSLSRQFIGVGGPALGAALVAAGGTSIAFSINALSFFLSAALIAPLPELPSAAPPGERSPILADLREGFATVLRWPWLWVTIALAALGNVTMSGPLSVAMPFLIKETLHAEVGALGLVSSMLALGAVLGSVWLGRFKRLRRRGVLAYGGLLLSGVVVGAFGLPIGLAGVAIGALVFGFAITMFGLVWTNTLQELVPREQLGRVSSIDMLGSFALLPLGYTLAGWATDQLGAPMVFMVGGALSVALALVGLAHSAIRKLD